MKNRYKNKGKEHPLFKNRIGEKYTTNQRYEVEIIEYYNCKNCTIKFNDVKHTVLKNVYYSNVKSGQIKNPYHKTVYGVGFIGEGKFATRCDEGITETYATWNNMLKKAYCKKYRKMYMNSEQTLVCKKWHNFQNFAEWYEENYKKGCSFNKSGSLYSPKTCCFLEKENYKHVCRKMVEVATEDLVKSIYKIINKKVNEL